MGILIVKDRHRKCSQLIPMKKITALLVDDEISALNTLRGMLGEYCPQVQVLAEATSVEEALQAVGVYDPQLVFLDVQMPPFGGGFDFLQQAAPRSFGVIFTTAHPQYALKAINMVQPWAYLLKPYSVADLVSAVQVAYDKLRMSGNQKSLIIPDSRKGNIVLRLTDILYLEADGNTTDIFVLRSDKIEKVMASRTLGSLEAELPESIFCRPHHSYIVNMGRIERYEQTGRNGLIYLPMGASISISVLKMEHFEARLATFLGQ